MQLRDGGDVDGLIRFVDGRHCIGQVDPETSQTFQDDAALRVSDALNRKVALSCFSYRVDRFHSILPLPVASLLGRVCVHPHSFVCRTSARWVHRQLFESGIQGFW